MVLFDMICIVCLFQVERNALLIDGGIGKIKDIFGRCLPCLKLIFFVLFFFLILQKLILGMTGSL